MLNNRWVLCWLLLTAAAGVRGQTDSVRERFFDDKALPVGALLLSGGLTGYGFATLKVEALQDVDQGVRKGVFERQAPPRFRPEDYMQYAPGLAVYGLNALGIHGRHDLWDRTVIYLAANGIMWASVIGLKHMVSAARPDGSGNDGFPSGHTAVAFAGAEFLAQEYKGVSPWIGIAGYTVASGTAYLRVYHDKHWFSEVVTGAGIGILSTKAVYWLWPVVRRTMGWRKKVDYKWYVE